MTLELGMLFGVFLEEFSGVLLPPRMSHIVAV